MLNIKLMTSQTSVHYDSGMIAGSCKYRLQSRNEGVPQCKVLIDRKVILNWKERRIKLIKQGAIMNMQYGRQDS
jgi:hypothetical protein